MKKIILAAALICLTAALAGCVPTERTDIMIDPDFEGKAGVPVDFVQLNNDALDQIDDKEAFAFVTAVDIDGNDDAKTASVAVKCLDVVSEEDCEAFTEVLLKAIGDAAASQVVEYAPGGKKSFGTFWDAFSVRIEFAKDGEESPFYVYEHTPGEPFTFKVDPEKYVEEYHRQKEIIEKNAS